MEIASIPSHVSTFLPVTGTVLVMLQFQTFVASNKYKAISLAGPQGLVLCPPLISPCMVQASCRVCVEAIMKNQKVLTDSLQKPDRVLTAPPSPENFLSRPRKLHSRSALIRCSCATLDQAAAKTVDRSLVRGGSWLGSHVQDHALALGPCLSYTAGVLCWPPCLPLAWLVSPV